jgi:hypothetical protein
VTSTTTTCNIKIQRGAGTAGRPLTYQARDGHVHASPRQLDVCPSEIEALVRRLGQSPAHGVTSAQADGDWVEALTNSLVDLVDHASDPERSPWLLPAASPDASPEQLTLF